MKKLSSLLICLLCVSLLCGCGAGSDAKFFTAQGDSAFAAGKYESALTSYEQAMDTGKATPKVKALCNIISTYIKACEAYENHEYEKAQFLLDDITYDYNGYAPINEDIRNLIQNIQDALKTHKRINRALDELKEAVNKSNFDTAYDLIDELDGYDLNDEQSEELEYQISRLYKLEEESLKKEFEKNKPSDDTPKPDSKTDKSEEKVEKPGEKYTNETSGETWYRVRKTWNDPKSQIHAMKSLENAKKAADENPGYKVFDENGKVVYP